MKSKFSLGVRWSLATDALLFVALGTALATMFVRAVEHPLLGALLPKMMCGILAVGGADLTTLAEDLQHHYLPGFNNQLQNATFLFDRFSRNPVVTTGGDAIYMFAITKRHGGKGARAENAPLPTAGSSGGVNPTSTTSKIFLPVQFSGALLDKAHNNRFAYLDALDLEMETAQDDGRLLLHHYLWLPKTSFRARIAGSPAAGVITVDNDGLVNSATGGRLQFILPGDYLDTVNGSGVVSQAGLLVVSTDIGANTITVTLNGSASSGAAADNDYIVLGDRAGGANDYNQGCTGLMSGLSTTNNTYWGIDRSTAANAFWRPQRFNGATYDFTNSNTWRAPLDAIEKFGANPDAKAIENQLEDVAILTSVEGRTLFAASLTDRVRYVNPTTTLAGGWTALEAHGRPLVADKDCPLGLYYYIRWADWNLYSELGQIGMTPEGRDGNLLRWLTGYDNWVMILRARMELGCKKPNRQAVMYGVPMTPVLPS